ncbi:MAG: hypothetical protein LBT35_04080 [Tannerella sp.]|jgi:hypothetical protein|nr:hypothetical protein [Tannerella sp.]
MAKSGMFGFLLSKKKNYLSSVKEFFFISLACESQYFYVILHRQVDFFVTETGFYQDIHHAKKNKSDRVILILNPN